MSTLSPPLESAITTFQNASSVCFLKKQCSTRSARERYKADR